MLEFLTNPFVLVFAFVFLPGIISAAGYYCLKFRQAQLDADLKMAMIQRGMSADEIERVLAAKTPPSTRKSWKIRPPIRPRKADRAPPRRQTRRQWNKASPGQNKLANSARAPCGIA